MPRLARAEVFSPDIVATVHVMARAVRRCFLLGTWNRFCHGQELRSPQSLDRTHWTLRHEPTRSKPVSPKLYLRHHYLPSRPGEGTQRFCLAVYLGLCASPCLRGSNSKGGYCGT